MSLAKTCTLCAAPLVDDAPDGAICESCSAARAAESTRHITSGDLDASAPAFTLPPATAHMAESIGDFEIIDKLGQGGMGAVYRARQASLGRIVALKVLPSQFQEDEEFVARFQREAKVAASLNHPNLVRVFTSGQAAGCHYIAMELVEGENLHQRLKRGPLSAPEALRICGDVARGLQCGWDRGQIVHRDIKPSNIYLDANGAVKLGDLGLAKSLLSNTTGLTQTGTMMGTPHYVSPEQARGEKSLDFRADIYSLGCTLFHMLAGHAPYDAADSFSVVNMHLNAPPPAILKALPGCPIPLARLVSRMLKKQPRERHASYDDLIAEIERVMELLVHGERTGPSAVVAGWRELNEGPIHASDVQRIADAVSKSKLPLFGAIAAGVAVLGSIAFFVMKPAKPRSTGVPPVKAGVSPASAGASGGTPKATSGTPMLREPTPAAVRLSPSAEPWQDVLRDPAKLDLSGGAVRTPEGVRFTQGSVAMLSSSQGLRRDGAARIRATFGGWPPRLYARWTSAAGHYQLYAKDENMIVLERYENAAKQYTTLRVFPLREPLQPGQDYELELRVVGQTLTAKLNGEILGTVTDGTHPEGKLGVDGGGRNNTAPALVKSLEVLDLDAPGGASTTPATATKDAPFVNTLGMKFVPVPGTQIRMCIHETRKQDYAAYAAANPGVSDAWQNQDRGGVAVSSGDDHPVVGVIWDEARAFCTWLGKKEGRIYRLPTDREWSFAVGIAHEEAADADPQSLGSKIPDVYPWGSQWPPPAGAGNYPDSALKERLPEVPVIDGYTDGHPTTAPVMSFKPNALGLHDLGGNVWEWCDGTGDATAQKRILRGGSWFQSDRRYLLSSGRDVRAPGAPARDCGFRVVEVGPVSGPSAASASTPSTTLPRATSSATSPALASNVRPFINTLGMKFVPVPIVGGPSAGQRVLFSVWETRVQDYEVFAKETKREWPKAEFAQEATHPAVNVSWEDATAFCAWLTERERKAGKLGANEVVRLPTDHEWSCAVGIGEREVAAKLPDTKDRKIADVFPWGSAWPPPEGAGNYWSEELRPALAAGKHTWIKGELPGYRDGFATTSPAGSFAANRAGLYDLGGNVWEWCDDWYAKEQTPRVLRGGCFGDFESVKSLSSCRGNLTPTQRYVSRGFRVVVGGASSGR